MILQRQPHVNLAVSSKKDPARLWEKKKQLSWGWRGSSSQHQVLPRQLRGGRRKGHHEPDRWLPQNVPFRLYVYRRHGCKPIRRTCSMPRFHKGFQRLCSKQQAIIRVDGLLFGVHGLGPTNVIRCIRDLHQWQPWILQACEWQDAKLWRYPASL